MASTRLKITVPFVFTIILFIIFSCKPERKPAPVLLYDFNIDSFISRLKSDTTLNADDAKFDKNDSLLIIYLVPDIPIRDSGSMRSHLKTLHVTGAIKRAKNISGLVFVKTPPVDSLSSSTYQYQILSSFFKAGTRFAEKK